MRQARPRARTPREGPGLRRIRPFPRLRLRPPVPPWLGHPRRWPRKSTRMSSTRCPRGPQHLGLPRRDGPPSQYPQSIRRCAAPSPRWPAMRVCGFRGPARPLQLAGARRGRVPSSLCLRSPQVRAQKRSPLSGEVARDATTGVTIRLWASRAAFRLTTPRFGPPRPSATLPTWTRARLPCEAELSWSVRKEAAEALGSVLCHREDAAIAWTGS